MKPKVLKTTADHQAALARIERLMDAPAGSPAEAELELWGVLVEKYEEEHFPVAPPDPVAAIEFRMAQMGLTRADLLRHVPHKSKVSEVMNHKRPLSLSMIRALSAGLKIPVALLVQETQAPYRAGKSGKIKPPSPRPRVRHAKVT